MLLVISLGTLKKCQIYESHYASTKSMGRYLQKRYLQFVQILHHIYYIAREQSFLFIKDPKISSKNSTFSPYVSIFYDLFHDVSIIQVVVLTIVL